MQSGSASVQSTEPSESSADHRHSRRASAAANIAAFVRGKPRLRAALDVVRFVVRTSSGPVLHCPLCGEDHRFIPSGMPPRPNAACPSCDSLERHRLLCLYLERFPELISGKAILHFAPEAAIGRFISDRQPAKYLTADLAPGRAEIVLSIENITLQDRFDTIVVSHILEHVNDRIALRELFKILKPGGLVIVMVPIVEGWASTYENSDITTQGDRLRHFGQGDHVRLYGRDLRDRIRKAGFDLHEFTASPADCLSMGLTPGETIFLAGKREDDLSDL